MSLILSDNFNGYGIYQSAFRGLDNLTSVTIPDSVTSIGSYALSYCTNLNDIYYTGSEDQWNLISKSDCGIPDTANIHYNYSADE